MGCNCGKRQTIIRAAVRATANGQSIQPHVRAFTRTIATDARAARLAIANRFGKK